MDTGAVIHGRLVDIYVPTLEEAVRYGRQPVSLRVIRQGWNPGQSNEETLAQGVRLVR
jgi:hypothetical protein